MDKNNDIIFDDLMRLLIENSDEFTPPLSQRINLNEYAVKLYNKTKIFSYTIDNHLVAVICVYVNCPPVAYISFVLCDKKHQRHGIMRQLYSEAEHGIKQAGCNIINLKTDYTNTPAQKFYIKNGFRETSNDKIEVQMQKQL